MSILVANGLTHWFGREVALESVDLAVDAGEHMAVLGENGAGKTTLLRILATAARPTSGRLEIMGLVALSSVAGRAAGLLSRGMQQRLAIGRAVLHDPKLLVLDEPAASLGSDGPDLLASVMRERTVVLATHDHALANRLCQRTLMLRHGRSVGTATRLHIVK